MHHPMMDTTRVTRDCWRIFLCGLWFNGWEALLLTKNGRIGILFRLYAKEGLFMGPILSPFFLVSFLALVEEARFMEAENSYSQGCYAQATDQYQRLINVFPNGTYRQKANQRLFEIANYWLEDTRQEMILTREQGELQGKVFRLCNLFPMDKSKPFFNPEGQALQTLQQVYHNDPDGPVAIKTLFYMGSVRFYRKDFQEAERHYGELFRKHPQSPYAPNAVKQVIICELLTIDEDNIDRKKLREVKNCIRLLKREYPDYAANEMEFLDRQIQTIQFLEKEAARRSKK
jgi:TolA-binding protein